MTRRWRSSICSGLFVLAALASPFTSEAAQSPDPKIGPTEAAPPAETSGQATETSPTVPVASTDLARIRRALDSEPAVKIDGDQLRFYMQIIARPLTFADFTKGYDFVNGPTRRGNPMTHNEFLAMVTPREMQSQVGITPRETLEFALTNWLSQVLIRKAYEDLKNARNEREVQQIRARIERELAQLKDVGVR